MTNTWCGIASARACLSTRRRQVLSGGARQAFFKAPTAAELQTSSVPQQIDRLHRFVQRALPHAPPGLAAWVKAYLTAGCRLHQAALCVQNVARSWQARLAIGRRVI
jgi:hypothetical protein